MNRDLRSVVQWAASLRAAEVPVSVRSALERLLRKPPRSPAQRWKPETDTKPARRQKHREETAKIREERMRIAGGRCEAVWLASRVLGRELVPQQVRCPQDGQHLHHLKGGSGRRREKQTIENTRMACWHHHQEAHRGVPVSWDGAQHPETKEAQHVGK